MLCRSILFIRQLTSLLPDSPPILALSVHPGAVGTEQQKGVTQVYPLLGKAIEAAGEYIFMTKEQGAESALWAGTGKSVVERKDEVNGRYFTEADGTVGCELMQMTMLRK
jgi:hypothetical protein